MNKKVATSLTINPETLKAAKALDINLSQALEEALLIKMQVPSKISDIKDKILEHKTKINFLEAKLEELNEQEAENNKLDVIKDYQEQITKLKHYKKQVVEGKLKIEIYNKMLQKVANAYNTNIDEVVSAVDRASFEMGVEQ